MITCFCFCFVSFATRRAPSMKTPCRSNAQIWGRSAQCRWTHKDWETLLLWPWIVLGGQDQTVLGPMGDFPFSAILTWSIHFGLYPEARPTSLRANILKSLWSSRVSQILMVCDKMSNFLHLALKLSMTQPFLCHVSSLHFYPITSCIPARFLGPRQYSGLKGLSPHSPHHKPGAHSHFKVWLSFYFLPIECSLATLALWLLSTELFSYIFYPVSTSRVWFLIINNAFVCSGLTGITGLLVQRLNFVSLHIPHSTFLMMTSLKCSGLIGWLKARPNSLGTYQLSIP